MTASTDGQDGTPLVRAPHVVVMGVTGCGKTTVGRLLAESLGARFQDGDELHPQANIEKMRSGAPLDDADREPWLRAVGGWLERGGAPAVIGCSALKRQYRGLIRESAGEVAFVHLHGTRELLADRLERRAGHFMPASLLDSQLQTLEPLEADETGVQLDIRDSVHELARAAHAWLLAADGRSAG